jgi:acetyl-CoA carboxylase biotin carboxyl carrier protein
VRSFDPDAQGTYKDLSTWGFRCTRQKARHPTDDKVGAQASICLPIYKMNQKELKELIEFLIEKDIAEFELERGDVKVRIKRAAEPAVTVTSTAVPHFAVPSAQPFPAAAPSAPIPVETPKEAAPAVEANLHIVRSPIVGTFYESPSPGSPPFVKPGDMIEVGQLLCIVEAMKLMNEIEADVAGEVVKRLVNNGQPIEYGQELFQIRAKK